MVYLISKAEEGVYLAYKINGTDIDCKKFKGLYPVILVEDIDEVSIFDINPAEVQVVHMVESSASTPARDMKSECWSCGFRRSIPGNTHIMCTCPDPDMEGEPYGVDSGWFNYPICFDPVWKLKNCRNFKEECS